MVKREFYFANMKFTLTKRRKKSMGKMKFYFDACGFWSVIGLPNMAPREENGSG